MSWRELIAETLEALTDAHRLRRRRIVEPLDAVRVRVDGRPLVNFCSNDYLGLSHHPAVIAAAKAATERYGAGSGAAPLVTGYTDAHAAAEAAIARWKGVESAVLLPSGYQANAAAIQAIAAVGEQGGPMRFVADKLVHASLIDALRSVRGAGGPRNAGSPERGGGSGAGTNEVRFYPHQQHAKLRRLLEQGGEVGGHACIVTESVFSMDGDVADLATLAQLREESAGRVLLLVDEAHGSGVFGEDGSGLAAELGLREQMDVSVATFSKAVGVAGGAVCGSKNFCDAVVSLGRAYMFSTAPPPSTAAAIEASLRVMREEPERQRRLRERCHVVRQRLVEQGALAAATSSHALATPIVPIILGEEAAALSASAQLAEAGYLVAAIRPPTVPRGTSRLRLTLSSEHTDEQIEGLLRTLRRMNIRAASAPTGKQPISGETIHTLANNCRGSP